MWKNIWRRKHQSKFMSNGLEQQEFKDPIAKPTRFSWMRVGKMVLVVAIIGGLAAGGWLLVNARPVKIAWASVILNNREHFLSCEQLPFFPEVEKAFREHQDAAEKVTAIAGVVDFSPQKIKCTNFQGGIEFIKGQALLKYKSRSARGQAESLIGKDFFRMPYRGESQ